MEIQPGVPADSSEYSKGTSATTVAKRFFEGMNKLLYPDPDPQVPVPVVPRREPDSAYYDALYSSEKVDMRRLRSLAARGIPEQFRSVYWKLLLGYLPAERALWPVVLMEGRNRYKSLLSSVNQPPKDTTETDHPLSQSSESAWNTFFSDKDMRDVIQRDISRTVPEIRFFCNSEKVNTVHGTALNNILFCYAKSNGKVHYVQGMNELAAVIYIVFATTGSEEDRKYCEEDTFSCFALLMGEVGETFNKELDTSMLESYFTIGRFQALLAILDPELYLNLNSKNIDPRFYALRWLSLLFSQEFPVPAVQRLWDSFLADDNRFNLLLFFACRIVMDVRNELIAKDFSQNLFLLQNLDIPDLELAIYNAQKLMHFTKPECLEPDYMMQYMKQLSKKHMTTQEKCAQDEQALKRDIENQKKKRIAAAKKKAAAESIASETSSSTSTDTTATTSDTTDTTTTSTTSTTTTTTETTAETAESTSVPVKSSKPSIRGALTEEFCTMPWHK